MTERQILKRIGENVKAARLKAELTQECLAELIGVHWQTISYIENGRNPFSVIILAKLAPALQTSPNRLLEGLPAANLPRAERIKRALARKRAPKKS